MQPDSCQDPKSDDLSRRDFLHRATAVSLGAAAAFTPADAGALGEASQRAAPSVSPLSRGGLLSPQQNQSRNLLELSGFWRFQLDPAKEGEAKRWFEALPAARDIPVPCSWNDLFDDAKNYLGLAWYVREVWAPAAWRGQRIFLRVGSANYAAHVWVNGTPAGEHQGGHLPFAPEVTALLAWDKPNVIAIAVENEQLPDRVPAGPVPGGGLFSGFMSAFPATTYDFFPYAGLHRPVVLCALPQIHIEDVTVTTALEGADGVVTVGSPGGGTPAPPKGVASGTRFFKTLYDDARRLDPTRPVTLVRPKIAAHSLRSRWKK